MRSLRCVVGLHQWTHTEAEYACAQAERLAVATKEATRTCTCCGKTQYEDRHLLGLNPPEYYSVWRTLQKP